MSIYAYLNYYSKIYIEISFSTISVHLQKKKQENKRNASDRLEFEVFIERIFKQDSLKQYLPEDTLFWSFCLYVYKNEAS